MNLLLRTAAAALLLLLPVHGYSQTVEIKLGTVANLTFAVHGQF